MAREPFTLDPTQHCFGLYAARQKEPAQSILDTEGFDPAKRTIMLLPGTRINHEVPSYILHSKFIPGMLNSVSGSLTRSGLEPADYNILCLAYTHNDEQLIANHFSDTLSKTHPAQTDSATPAGTDVHEFVEKALFPYIGLTNTHRPSVEEATAQLAKLTLVGHSFGTTFVHEVGRCFHHRLTQNHGYSDADATTMMNELVGLLIANVSRMDLNEPSFRTVAFCARRDETSWEITGRIAEDHARDGHLPEGCDLACEQARLYDACGYDASLMQQPREDIRYAAQARVAQPRPANTGLGRIIEIDTPEKITWERTRRGETTTMEMSQESLDAECAQLKLGVCTLRQSENDHGLNTQPLMREGLVPAHDIRMYVQPADRNHAISQKFDAVLAAAATREALRSTDIAEASISRIARADPARLALGV